MNWRTIFASVALATTGALCIGEARAQESGCATVNRTTVVTCALRANLAARAEQLTLESFEGKRRAASVLLPSNPSLALGGGYTIDPSLPAADRQLLWSATLSQEIEIAGQRGKRIDVVTSEQHAQRARVETAKRETATTALVAYFDALAAIEQAKVATRLGQLGTALKTVARARAQAGVASDLDARLADSAATRLLQAQLIAEQRVPTTNATVATLLGLDPLRNTPLIEGELAPLSVVDAEPATLVEPALTARADVTVAVAEREAQERRIALYQRLRIPNPTFSVFVRKDWVGEQNVGIGVGFPIPLPGPVGRTYAGEIAEATALAKRAGTEVEQLRRSVRLEVVTAAQLVASRRRQVDLYPAEQVRQTENALRSIAEELEAGRLTIREALHTQQELIDFLVASVEARRSLCVASVELARAAGLPLERGAR